MQGIKLYLRSEVKALEKAVSRLSGERLLYYGLVIIFLCFALGYLISTTEISKFEDFSIIVVGLIIQALPFLLIGTVISSFIGTFISDKLIVKLFPEKGIVATLSAIGIGAILPLCDCAVIPVAARLRKKGVPVPAVVTFMMAAPIVNPVVILSTVYAFSGTGIAIYRVVAGLIIAILTGAFFSGKGGKEILRTDLNESAAGCTCGHHNLHTEHSLECCCTHTDYGEPSSCNFHSHVTEEKTRPSQKLINALSHSGEEFFHVSKLFILGVLVTSAIQIFIPKDIIVNFAGNKFSAVFVMMTLAFVMSICSTSDAFIGRTFMSSIPMSGIFGFIVFGPILDLKNAIMLTGFFKKKFVVEFIAAAFFISFSVISIASIILYK